MLNDLPTSEQSTQDEDLCLFIKAEIDLHLSVWWHFMCSPCDFWSLVSFFELFVAFFDRCDEIVFADGASPTADAENTTTASCVLFAGAMR